MQFFRLKKQINRNGSLFDVFIKTDEDLTNQEIIVLGKRSYAEIEPEKLDTETCIPIEPAEFWRKYDHHFADF